jgi:hypothetical protein
MVPWCNAAKWPNRRGKSLPGGKVIRLERKLAMELYKAKSRADRAREEQAFYDAYGNNTAGPDALKLLAAIPLTIMVYAGLLAGLSLSLS